MLEQRIVNSDQEIFRKKEELWDKYRGLVAQYLTGKIDLATYRKETRSLGPLVDFSKVGWKLGIPRR